MLGCGGGVPCARLPHPRRLQICRPEPLRTRVRGSLSSGHAACRRPENSARTGKFTLTRRGGSECPLLLQLLGTPLSPRPRHTAPRASPARSRATPPRAAPPCQGSPGPRPADLRLQSSPWGWPCRNGVREREFIPRSGCPSGSTFVPSTYGVHKLQPWTEDSGGIWFRVPGSTDQGRRSAGLGSGLWSLHFKQMPK